MSREMSVAIGDITELGIKDREEENFSDDCDEREVIAQPRCSALEICKERGSVKVDVIVFVSFSSKCEDIPSQQKNSKKMSETSKMKTSENIYNKYQKTSK
jgi:precorrin-6B methylase 1